MDIDLPFYLFWGVVVTGALTLADQFYLRPRRDPEANMPIVIEYSRSFFPILLLVFVVRGFVIEPYQIPSESMVPNLKVGNFILVNKYEYGLRMPVFGTKLVSIGEPARGDMMVFVPPHDERYFIKRVIGIPGDRVKYQNKALWINGVRVSYKLLGEFRDGRTGVRVQEYSELLGEQAHSIYRTTGFEPTQEWEIGPGQYLMMGDNRDNSADSRAWGLADEKNIVGRAVAVWMHKEPGWNWPTFIQNRWL
ncbi:MAG TPA: signal peptidase I [Gammaproteobacteria bacterium]|nr:signal peptidase I [Gammaproteobacteria bacterium]|tara:strand:- start:1950 stop:2699 length:750 start_codon:yes stop_codon:yes gene_type:complete